jgi:flagellar biosynthesis protein FlhB
MADENESNERTEDPTPRRLDEAIQRGDVAGSIEVNTWFMIAAGTLLVMVFAAPMATSLQATFAGLLAKSYEIHTDGPALIGLFETLSLAILGAIGIPLVILGAAAFVANVVQHRIVFTLEPIRPQLSRLSPVNGLSRIFSTQGLANIAKGLAKVGVVGTVMTALLWPERHLLGGLVATDPAAILPIAQGLIMKMLGAVVAVLAVVATVDYLLQYRQWYERHKMSLREVKEEYRQTEGDPIVKGKLKQLRTTRMRKRIMAAVPKASVVITNPTHFAVALKYERGMTAPVCVAKGVDLLARKIREIAEAHDIPVVENPPLARALHGTVDIDQEIPPEHYRAVAEIIGYIMRLRRMVAPARPL